MPPLPTNDCAFLLLFDYSGGTTDSGTTINRTQTTARTLVREKFCEATSHPTSESDFHFLDTSFYLTTAS